jgi:hypothetical protein
MTDNADAPSMNSRRSIRRVVELRENLLGACRWDAPSRLPLVPSIPALLTS